MDRGAWRVTIHGVESVRYDLMIKPTYLPTNQPKVILSCKESKCIVLGVGNRLHSDTIVKICVVFFGENIE